MITPAEIEKKWDHAKKYMGLREDERAMWEKSLIQAQAEFGPESEIEKERRARDQAERDREQAERDAAWEDFEKRAADKNRLEDDFKADVLARLDALETGAKIPSPNSKRSYLILINALAEMAGLDSSKPYGAESSISTHLEKNGKKLAREFIGKTLQLARFTT